MALIVSGLAPSVRVLLPEFFFSSRRRHTRFKCDWSSDMCSSDLISLEHLILHAHHVGVTICVENTTSEMGDPGYLRDFVDETRLAGLRFNFDIGHAILADFPEN